MNTLSEQRSIRFGLVLLSLAVLLWNAAALRAAWDTIVFQDEFNYAGNPDQSKWLINRPEWWSLKGRSHFPEPTDPGAHLPWVDGNACHIDHYQYNSSIRARHLAAGTRRPSKAAISIRQAMVERLLPTATTALRPASATIPTPEAWSHLFSFTAPTAWTAMRSTLSSCQP